MDLVFGVGDTNLMNANNSSPTSSRLRFHGFGAIIKNLFRILEVSFALFFLAWASTRLPLVVRISGEYFRRLISILLSHFFIFLLSNLIVLTLFFKSRKQQLKMNISCGEEEEEEEEAHLDFCQEFIRNIDGGRSHLITGSGGGETPPPRENHVVYQDKQMILEGPKIVRRSRSENLIRRSGMRISNKRRQQQQQQQLRRSETEKWRPRTVVDDLSNEEFRREIEAFIARQTKFHQEEKLAIVLHG